MHLLRLLNLFACGFVVVSIGAVYCCSMHLRKNLPFLGRRIGDVGPCFCFYQ